MDLQQLKYPIGPFRIPQNPAHQDVSNWIQDIENFPRLLERETKNLSEVSLEWKYRPGGWNIRQLVHHCADSHLNSLTRFKLALTEENPTIRPYFEDKWAELADSKAPIEWSLTLIDGLHKRWVFLLKSLTEEELKKTFHNPESKKSFALFQAIALYAWHGNHHLAHVRQAKNAKGSY